jgi:hypothetical protein
MSEQRPLPDLASLGVGGPASPRHPRPSFTPPTRFIHPVNPTPRAATPGAFPVPAILAATGASVAATTTDNAVVKTFSPHFRIPRSPRLSSIAALNPNGGKRIFNCLISRLPSHQLNFLTLPSPPPSSRSAGPAATVDLRYRFPPVYDQGALGSCTAQALCAAFTFNAPGFTGSRLFLYYNERLLEKTITYDSGAYLHDGITAMKTYGLCSESLCPYIISKYAVKPTPAMYTAALADRVLTAKNIQPTLATMKQALSQGYPFVFGFVVYSSFLSNSASTTGIIPMPAPRESVLGGHAVVAVGYDDARQLFIFRNSWGSGWGDHGYGYIPYAYISNASLTSDLWYITSVKK